jgi:hypothetical protein
MAEKILLIIINQIYENFKVFRLIPRVIAFNNWL